MLPVHVLNKSVFQNWRGNRKKREKRWQLQSHKKSMIRVWWGLYTPGSLSFPSKSWWEHTGHWPRDPDSNCSSFTTCENLWQNRSRLQASVFPSVKWLVWISNFSLCFCEILYLRYMVSLAAQIVVCLQCSRPRFDPWVRKIPSKREWQPTPVFFAWEISWTEEPGGVVSMGVTMSRMQLSN